jgi:hypothetical protein
MGMNALASHEENHFSSKYNIDAFGNLKEKPSAKAIKVQVRIYFSHGNFAQQTCNIS